MGASPSPDAKFSKDIMATMQKFVDNHSIAGSVTLVAGKDKVLSFDAVGFADLSAQSPMKKDSLFWIASMTKPMTAVLVLMLQDEKKLSVEDPVSKYLPEFQNQWMIRDKTTNRMELVPAARPITLRDLLTHTSGLGDVTAPRPHCSLAELVMAFAQQPLRSPPGSKWEYSNAGINTLGRIVEVVSGVPFAEFMQKRLFNPLKMKSTTFWPDNTQIKRLAKSYQPNASGKDLEETQIYFVKGAMNDRQRTPYPAGGLFSTAEDLCRFYQMMLQDGVCQGKRLLSSDSLNIMTKTQSGDIKTGFTEGMSFGFGFAVVKNPTGVTGMLSPGTFGHGGAYGTQSWADPQKNRIVIMMIQRAKLPNGDASEMRKAFQETALKEL